MTVDVDLAAAAAGGFDAEELAELVAVTQRFAATAPAQMAASLDRGDLDAVEDCWSGVREIGLDRCLLPESLGGIGLARTGLLPLLEELAVGDGGVALTALLSNIALACLAERSPQAAGEQERGAFVAAAKVHAVESGRISGSDALAFGVGGATQIVIAVGRLGSGGLFAVDGSSSGLRRSDDVAQLGLGGSPALALEFDSVAATGLGDATAATALLHAGVGAIACGVARRAEQMALEYAAQRYQGGGPIIGHGAVRDMLARMAERRLTLCARADEGLASALAYRIAATDAAVATTTDAVQVFGGMGYMVETGIEKLMRDAKSCQLYPEPNWLARDHLLELASA